MKQKTIKLLEEFIKKSTEIDKETSWQDDEPYWWEELMAIRRQVYKSLEGIRNCND